MAVWQSHQSGVGGTRVIQMEVFSQTEGCPELQGVWSHVVSCKWLALPERSKNCILHDLGLSSLATHEECPGGFEILFWMSL